MHFIEDEYIHDTSNRNFKIMLTPSLQKKILNIIKKVIFYILNFNYLGNMTR